MDRTTKILRIIQNNPGIYVKEILRKSKLENGVVFLCLSMIYDVHVVRLDYEIGQDQRKSKLIRRYLHHALNYL